MQDYIITIDGGTTNTRCILWDGERKQVAEAKREIGVRNTSIDGNNDKLKNAVKECIEELLEKGSIGYEDIYKIIGSGMITSDVGLTVVPWIPAPAGLKELAEHAVEKALYEICPLPITFIPGVKNSEGPLSFDNLEAMDIMRGEEVECMAILDELKTDSPMLMVLPGSHNKFISVSRDGKITGCLTSISGELLSSITNDTIIAKSVGKQFVGEEDYDKEWVLRGFENAKKVGLTRACFSARISMLFLEKDEKKLANYILGASIADDMVAARNSTALTVSPDTLVVVGGKMPLRTAVADVIKADGYFTDVQEYVPSDSVPLSAKGQYLVASRMGLL